MFDVTGLGESLIDLTECGLNELGVKLMACNPGGAPANCLAMCTKLGGRTAMLGMVGNDSFGHYLAENMSNAEIDISGMIFSDEYPTTLAVVALDKGERSFSFYRKPSADMMMRPDDIKWDNIDNCKIFHFGGVSLTAGPCIETTLSAAAYAKSKNKIVSYDPNYRDKLWENPDTARIGLRKAIPLCDILKVNDDELLLLTGQTDPFEGAKMLKALGPSIVLITLGGEGAFYMNDVCCGKVNSYAVKAVDTTGAGDAFTGAFLNRIKSMHKSELPEIDDSILRKFTQFACAAGALTTTKYGAIPALPGEREIHSLMKQV